MFSPTYIDLQSAAQSAYVLPLATGQTAGRPSQSIAARFQAMRGFEQAPVEQVSKGLAEEMYDARAAFKIRTSAISMHMGRSSRDRLFSQLDSLLDADEWEVGDDVPSQQSFETFLKLLFTLKMAIRPSLGASHHGDLVAAWMLNEGTLTVECQPGDRVIWAISQKSDAGAGSAAGRCPLSTLKTSLSGFGVEEWSKARRKVDAD